VRYRTALRPVYSGAATNLLGRGDPAHPLLRSDHNAIAEQTRRLGSAEGASTPFRCARKKPRRGFFQPTAAVPLARGPIVTGLRYVPFTPVSTAVCGDGT